MKRNKITDTMVQEAVQRKFATNVKFEILHLGNQACTHSYI